MFFDAAHPIVAARRSFSAAPPDGSTSTIARYASARAGVILSSPVSTVTQLLYVASQHRSSERAESPRHASKACLCSLLADIIISLEAFGCRQAPTDRPRLTRLLRSPPSTFSLFSTPFSIAVVVARRSPAAVQIPKSSKGTSKKEGTAASRRFEIVVRLGQHLLPRPPSPSSSSRNTSWSRRRHATAGSVSSSHDIIAPLLRPFCICPLSCSSTPRLIFSSSSGRSQRFLNLNDPSSCTGYLVKVRAPLALRTSSKSPR